MSTPTVIAIDGPVASGKTAVGRELARRLGYRFIDTGIMYRACTLLALRRNVPLSDEKAMTELANDLELSLVEGESGNRLIVDGEDVTGFLRTPEVEAHVSTASAIAGVREAMVAHQRRIAQDGQIVMVGRDVGTTVLPHAAKVFLLASVDVRVQRRLAEVNGNATEDEVRRNIELRDRLDSGRAASPLRVAEDAVQVDTDGLDVTQVVDRIVEALDQAASR